MVIVTETIVQSSMEEIVRLLGNPKSMLTVLKQCFRHEANAVPWIGFRFHGEQGAFLWVNGEEVEANSTTWAAGEVIQETAV